MSDPTTVHFCPDFTDTDADLIIASSDEVYFRVHKFILGKASPIFLDMFAIPTSLDDAEGPQTVQLTESSWVVEAMLRMCYPMARHILTDLWQAIELLAIGRKYSMQAVVDGATNAVASWSYEGEQAPRFFAFAVHIGDEQLIKRGVVECLRMSFSDLVVDANATGLELIPASTFQELLQLHRRCTTTAIHTASSSPWLAYEDRPWCSGCRNQIFVPENGMKPDTLHRFILFFFFEERPVQVGEGRPNLVRSPYRAFDGHVAIFG